MRWVGLRKEGHRGGAVLSLFWCIISLTLPLMLTLITGWAVAFLHCKVTLPHLLSTLCSLEGSYCAQIHIAWGGTVCINCGIFLESGRTMAYFFCPTQQILLTIFLMPVRQVKLWQGVEIREKIGKKFTPVLNRSSSEKLDAFTGGGRNQNGDKIALWWWITLEMRKVLLQNARGDDVVIHCKRKLQ